MSFSCAPGILRRPRNPMTKPPYGIRRGTRTTLVPGSWFQRSRRDRLRCTNRWHLSGGLPTHLDHLTLTGQLRRAVAAHARPPLGGVGAEILEPGVVVVGIVVGEYHPVRAGSERERQSVRQP